MTEDRIYFVVFLQYRTIYIESWQSMASCPPNSQHARDQAEELGSGHNEPRPLVIHPPVFEMQAPTLQISAAQNDNIMLNQPGKLYGLDK